MDTRQFMLRVNGRREAVRASPDTPLLFVLRNELGLTAAKVGCALEQCYACAVLVDGKATPTCSVPVGAFGGREITTVEGLSDGEELHAVQQAFIVEQAAQCGYCTPGMIIGVVSLLAQNPSPSDEEIRTALAPHLCRCGSHPQVLRAVKTAAEILKQ